MTVNPVFRHILFSPKIWGLGFPSMIACMLTLICGFFAFGGLGMLGKFLVTVLITGLVYGILYWKDNRDEVAYHARRHCRIRRVVAAYSISNHYLQVE